MVTIFKMSQQFQQEEEYAISDLETLKVLSDPFRMQILEAMCCRGPTTVKSVAEHLGVSPKKLYYHVNLLEKHGLIVVVDTQLVSGIVEKWYQARAFRYAVDKSLLALADERDDQFENLEMLVSGIFDAARSEIIQAARQGLITPDEADAQCSPLFIMRGRVALRPGQLDAFGERLTDLLRDLKNEAADGDVEPHGFTIVVYPQVASSNCCAAGDENEGEGAG